MDHTNCLQVAIKTLQFDLFENKQEHEEALKSANFELVKQGVHFTCSQCGLHSSLFDYDEHAHSTSNFDDETAAHEIYAGSARASDFVEICHNITKEDKDAGDLLYMLHGRSERSKTKVELNASNLINKMEVFLKYKTANILRHTSDPLCLILKMVSKSPKSVPFFA
jgi:hypothetical protein